MFAVDVEETLMYQVEYLHIDTTTLRVISKYSQNLVSPLTPVVQEFFQLQLWQ